MKTLIFSAFLLLLISCGGGSSGADAGKAAQLEKAAVKAQVTKIQNELLNELRKRCPGLKVPEMTKADADSIQENCTSDELAVFNEALVCSQKITCEDTVAMETCGTKLKGLSRKCSESFQRGAQLHDEHQGHTSPSPGTTTEQQAPAADVAAEDQTGMWDFSDNSNTPGVF